MTYGQTAPITSPGWTQYQQEIDSATKQADPTIRYHFARRNQDADNSLANPFGANVAPETLEAMRHARKSQIGTEHGQALAEDAFRRKQLRLGHYGQYASGTSPRIVQTGGTTTGTVSQGPNWGGMISGGISSAFGI